MTTKIFLTGGTGYIGGDALHAIVHAHPDYDISVLVRDSTKGALFAKQYPQLRLVYGNLDDTSVLTTEAAAADIVVHCAHADHVAAAQALVKGLQSKTAGTGYLIHTGGAGILCVDDMAASRYGEPLEKMYDDWEGLSTVTSLPDNALHRDVDKIVLGANSETVRTAIVCPPTIYGPGRGPGNRRSNQAYNMARSTLKRSAGIQVGRGLVKWAEVHVHDLSDIYLKLVEAAVQGGGKAGTFGPEGYYFAENGEFIWGEVGAAIAKEAAKRGLAKDQVDSLTPEEANKESPFSAILWGTNARCKAVRARKLLGWEPKGRKLYDEEIPDIVEGEAKVVGLIKGHAQLAAGQ